VEKQTETIFVVKSHEKMIISFEAHCVDSFACTNGPIEKSKLNIGYYRTKRKIHLLNAGYAKD